VTPSVTVRPAGPADHPWVVDTARLLLGDAYQVHTRRQFNVLDGDVLVAELDRSPTGFATWVHDGASAELLAIAVRDERRGAGRALVGAVRDDARAAGCERLVVVTTDENLGAQRFYESTGFALAERRVGAVDECRRRYKPSIPPDIHDEMEYGIELDDDPAEEAR
jgi:ribosomal protein S18 acetylase RimI-like enzyme